MFFISLLLSYCVCTCPLRILLYCTVFIVAPLVRIKIHIKWCLCVRHRDRLIDCDRPTDRLTYIVIAYSPSRPRDKDLDTDPTALSAYLKKQIPDSFHKPLSSWFTSSYTHHLINHSLVLTLIIYRFLRLSLWLQTSNQSVPQTFSSMLRSLLAVFWQCFSSNCTRTRLNRSSAFSVSFWLYFYLLATCSKQVDTCPYLSTMLTIYHVVSYRNTLSNL